MHRLRDYWCNRWDELALRELLSRNYIPRYFVETEYLDGFYIKLKYIDFLWFRGLFSVGRHLKSGVYYQDPIHLSFKGLGPRQLVFPLVLVNHLDKLALLGDWTRYQYSANGWLNDSTTVVKPKGKGINVTMRVEQVAMGYPPPVLSRWGKRTNKVETVCLKGKILAGKLASYTVDVPISEVYWNYFTKM